MSDPFGSLALMRSTRATRPWPPMSATFAEYAQPIIEQLPPRHAPAQLRRALLIASGVWNAMVAEQGDVDAAVEFVTRVLAEETKEPVPDGLSAAIERLAVRKLARFDDDDRLVTNVELQGEGNRFRVWLS